MTKPGLLMEVFKVFWASAPNITVKVEAGDVIYAGTVFEIH